MPGAGELPGGGPARREEILARPEPTQVGAGVGGPAGCSALPVWYSGPGSLPGSPGRRIRSRRSDDPKELWGGRGSHGSLGGPGHSRVLCGWSGGGWGVWGVGVDGEGREQPPRVLQGAAGGSGLSEAPAATRTASGASADSRGQRSPTGEAGQPARGGWAHPWPGLLAPAGGGGHRVPSSPLPPPPPQDCLSRHRGRLSEA